MISLLLLASTLEESTRAGACCNLSGVGDRGPSRSCFGRTRSSAATGFNQAAPVNRAIVRTANIQAKILIMPSLAKIVLSRYCPQGLKGVPLALFPYRPDGSVCTPGPLFSGSGGSGPGFLGSINLYFSGGRV